jgi:hypothetical protein
MINLNNKCIKINLNIKFTNLNTKLINVYSNERLWEREEVEWEGVRERKMKRGRDKEVSPQRIETKVKCGMIEKNRERDIEGEEAVKREIEKGEERLLDNT